MACSQALVALQWWCTYLVHTADKDSLEDSGKLLGIFLRFPI